MALGSVENEDIAGGSRLQSGGDMSADFAGFQSAAGVACVVERNQMATAHVESPPRMSTAHV